MQAKRFQIPVDVMSETGFAGRGEYSEKEHPDTDQSSGLLNYCGGISADHHSQLPGQFQFVSGKYPAGVGSDIGRNLLSNQYDIQ